MSDRYESTMARPQQITQAGYRFRFQWECEFDPAGIVEQKPESLTNPIVEQSPLNTRDALYGGRTETMRLRYKVRENETIKYVDVMSLHRYI